MRNAVDEDARQHFEAIWCALLPTARAVPDTMVHRDFFVENLLLLPRPGLTALGLLDFQDAVVGPITFDLASLLEDARRDLPAPLIDAMRARYRAAFSQLSGADFDASWAVMAAHRHVKAWACSCDTAWRWQRNRSCRHRQIRGRARSPDRAYVLPVTVGLRCP